MQVFLLPDLGEGLTEAELVNWLVAVGDQVRVDQPVAEVETAKAVVEVPSPYAGVVAQLHGAAGQTMDVGKPLISINSESVTGADPAKSAEHADSAQESDSVSGHVLIGYGTSGEANTGRTRARKHPVAEAAPVRQQGGQTPQAHRSQAVLVSSPLVRRMAKDKGLALAQISGSGPAGMIRRRDVEAAAAGQQSDTDARTGLGITERTEFTGLRKTVSANLRRSRREIPEATVWVDVDATALWELRDQLKKSEHPVPGLLAFVARFVLAGLVKFPELNTRVESTDSKETLVAFDGVNLGFAVQGERGLVVPSIERADRLSARQLDSEIKALTETARSGKATPAQLGRGTFTLNNYGVFRVDGSAAIINYPEVAMLGIGRIMDRPWVVNGELAVRKVTELTLAFDHRVCDGGTAGGFLRYVADAIENPGSVLADL